jgi:site-specific DNA-cytosine methylase
MANEDDSSSNEGESNVAKRREVETPYASECTNNTEGGTSSNEEESNDAKRRKVEIPFVSECMREYMKNVEFAKGKGAFMEELQMDLDDYSESDATYEEDMHCTSSAKSKVITSKLQKRRQSRMSDQSLCNSNDEQDWNDEEYWIFCTNFEDRILEQDSFQYDGTMFYKNKRYWIDDDSNEQRMFAIKHFLSNTNETNDTSSALCVEIIEFKQTVLETVQDTSELQSLGFNGVDKYIQRAGSEEEILLSKMEAEVEDSEKLPDWMYIERQKGSSALLFGLVDISKTPTRNGLRTSLIRGIDFFAGAGLASRGLEASCCSIVASVEKNKEAVQSYARIHGAIESEVSADDWKDILNQENGRVAFRGTVEEFLFKYNDTQAFQEALGFIDIVILCPPCQGFSKMNVFKEGEVEQNNRESLRILAAAEYIHPKVLVFENVLGLWETAQIKEYFQEIVYGLANLGYNVQVGKLSAADFGDPQLRPRLILIASLSEIGLPVYPRATHGPPFVGSEVTGGLLPFVTARDALKPEEAKHPEHETPISDDGLRKPNEPAGSVLASKSAPHYSKNRLYSLAENAILMGMGGAEFVAKLEGNKALKQRQIGNGVPMELTSAIGRAVQNVLKWNWEGVDDELHCFKGKGSNIQQGGQKQAMGPLLKQEPELVLS